MTLELGLPKSFARFAAIVLVAFGASACSSVPNWVDPTNWIGGDDQTASADTDSSSASTPDVASIPDKPVAPSTVDERTQVADTLKADRADAQYSGDALRGGTEPSAASPQDAPPVEATLNSTSPKAVASTNQTPVAPPPAESTAQQTTVASDSASASSAQAPAATQTQTTADEAAPATPVAPAQVASTEAAPPVTSTPAATMSDEQLGFAQSKAPPLDPSVAQFVPRAVMDQYRQTTTTTSTTAQPALTQPVQQKADPAQSSLNDSHTDGYVRQAVNYRVNSGTAPTVSRTAYSGMVTPAAYAPPQQSQPKTVVFFTRDAAAFGAKAKAQILAAAQTFQSGTGSGFVRVVGHSSSRTADMPMARHLEVVFEHSQDFATAVANELIRDGVPADKVLIEAVGDSQPVYYESMPQGEAGNRRAEIFM